MNRLVNGICFDHGLPFRLPPMMAMDAMPRVSDITFDGALQAPVAVDMDITFDDEPEAPGIPMSQAFPGFDRIR